MHTPRQLLTQRVREALHTLFPDLEHDGELITPTTNFEHGDYQCNRALQMAKAARANPRALATRLVETLQVDDLCARIEIAGPGFVNFFLSEELVARQVRERLGADKLGVEPASPARTYVVDFSSPNVAKPMHVGHIRSTLLGETLCRMLRFCGHQVLADNHLGDWGTQFGMMILGYHDYLDAEALAHDPIQELKRIYQCVVERCKVDEVYAGRAREELARLQQGDPDNLALWKRFIDLSRSVFETIYQRLDIHFDTWHGESFYNDMLGPVVEELTTRGLAREDAGARVIFFDEPEELRERPFLVQKSDGAYLYATSDLAALRYRVDTYKPDAILYVTDGRQQLHFKQLFAVARLWGYQDLELVHVWFGTILGEDNKPIKTREGAPIELAALLDEAEERALAITREKQPDLEPAHQSEVARRIGLGAVKYADLAQNRTSDYAFSWDKMLAMQGNTSPYLQYAYVRIRSLLDKAGINPQGTAPWSTLRGSPWSLHEPTELALAKKLLQLADILGEALQGYRPNLLTTYLFETASLFSAFYEQCPVLGAAEPVVSARLALCALTAQTIQTGLHLLGIETLERM